MSLHLDARQRAMLQEMGVTVWAPQEAPEPRAADVAPAPPVRAAAPAITTPTAVASPAGARPQQSAPPRPSSPPRHNATGVAAPAPSVATHAAAPLSLQLHAPTALYPAADPAQTPAGLGAGWLIVAESVTPGDPLGGDAGRLLDNMLRAMQLHKHPRVFLAALERTAPGANGEQAGDAITAALAAAVASLQPALVLVLGHVAARAALCRTEPLGRLRASPHQLANCPAVVTYDPAFLLRSQDVKAAAWADLCRALAIVRQAAPR